MEGFLYRLFMFIKKLLTTISVDDIINISEADISTNDNKGDVKIGIYGID